VGKNKFFHKKRWFFKRKYLFCTVTSIKRFSSLINNVCINREEICNTWQPILLQNLKSFATILLSVQSLLLHSCRKCYLDLHMHDIFIMNRLTFSAYWTLLLIHVALLVKLEQGNELSLFVLITSRYFSELIPRN